MTNRTYTARQQRTKLARIDGNLTAARAALAALEANIGNALVADALGDAWNALHDAVTALEVERREVELNRLTGTTADLVAANID